MNSLKNAVSNWENNFTKIDNIKNNLEELSDNYNWFKRNIYDEIFPIGSYYINSSKMDPSNLFVGIWEQIKNRFINGTSNNYAVKSKGGEAQYKLTESEMPKHKHNSLYWPYWGRYLYGGEDNSGNGPASGYGFRLYLIDYYTSETGGEQPHNNIPLYKAAFILKRIE